MGRFKSKTKVTKHDRVTNIIRTMWDYPDVNWTCCKKFGCGKRLEPLETLYGDYCIKHKPENKSPLQGGL